MNAHTPEIIIADPNEALELLIEGNRRFVDAKLLDKKTHDRVRESLSGGQHPFAVVICCSDSRVSPEIFFDQRLGDIFVIRNAGNIVDAAVLGSVEYAILHLGCRLVTVIGHSGCGAVTTACGDSEITQNVKTIVDCIAPSKGNDTSVDEVAGFHAKRMAGLIEDDLEVFDSHVLIKPAFFDIRSGLVTWL